MCVDMIKKMSNPGHKLHHILLMKVSQLRERETRTDGLEYYNYACRTNRFIQSPIIYVIRDRSLIKDRGGWRKIRGVAKTIYD
jgi:hypothetical protein